MRHVLFALLAFALAACPAPGPEPDPADDAALEELTDEQILAVLAVGAAELEARPDWTTADQEAAAAALGALPEVAEAGVAEGGGTVWAMYVDGGGLALVDNRTRDGAPPPPPGPPPADGERGAAVAWATHTLGTAFRPVSETVAGWLEGYGWTVSRDAPTVERLRAMSSETALLYLDAHGGRARIRARGDSAGAQLLGPNPRWLTGVQTATPVDADTLREHRADRRAGKLFVAAVAHDALPNGGRTVEDFFFFTAAFVVDEMEMRDDGFVFVNACDSYDETLLEGFGTIGASVFWGWDQPVRDGDAGGTAEFAFDALLGVGEVIDETPPFRPFGWLEVYAELQRRNLDVDQDGAQLFAAELGDGFDVLVPSIREMTVDEAGAGLVLFGDFGERPGAVRYAGAEIEVQEWTDSVVRAVLPAGGGGDVSVDVEGRMGNIAPVTGWRAEFHYFESLEGGTNQYDCVVGFRADVHPHRDAMDDEPSPPAPLLEPEYGECDWSMSGSYGDVVIAGEGTVHLGEDFAFAGAFDLEAMEIELTSWSIVAQGTATGPDGTTPIAFTPSDPFAAPHPVEPLVLEMDAAYGVAAGSRGAFSWDYFVGDPAPDAFTPAR